MHPRIELVYDPECPNVERTRAAIHAALAAVGAPIAWREWDCTDPATAESLRFLGSPSVLVNGQDVGCGSASVRPAAANSCRIYQDECGCNCGAPSVDLILRAFANSASDERA